MSAKLWAEIGLGIYETFYMTLASTLLGYVIGLPLGVILIITRRDGIRQNLAVNQVLGVIVNIMRSIPFLILMIAIIPFTRFVMGKSYGSTATIVPLTMAAFPFISRMVESSLAEVDGGVIEAAQAMGATPMQIIRKVYLPEATPSLISAPPLLPPTTLGYSAMDGSVGGGGLGAIAINYGYYRFNAEVMVVCIAIMVVLVQAMQLVGTRLSVQLDHRLR